MKVKSDKFKQWATKTYLGKPSFEDDLKDAFYAGYDIASSDNTALKEALREAILYLKNSYFQGKSNAVLKHGVIKEWEELLK